MLKRVCLIFMLGIICILAALIYKPEKLSKVVSDGSYDNRKGPAVTDSALDISGGSLKCSYEIIKNALVTDISEDDKEIVVFKDGSYTKYNVAPEMTGEKETREKLPFVSDVYLQNDTVKSCDIKNNSITDKITAVSKKTVHTAKNGSFTISDQAGIYDISNGIRAAKTNEIPLGYEVTDIILGDDSAVCAFVIKSDIKPDIIRVAIKTSGYRDYYHKKVTVGSDKGMIISFNEQSSELSQDDSVTYDMNNIADYGGRITISPANGGSLAIKSIKRGYGTPVYNGSLEISSREKGLIIINEVTMNEYLYSVVPSEMPSDYPAEALKAQAVCARSYAYIHVKSGNLSKLGAHVDDSTSYQVYNNTHRTKATCMAVDATSGQVLTYDGQVVPAYYYSTSCGMTANGGEVWLGMKNVPYLKSKIQTMAKDTGHSPEKMKEEKEFKKFLKSDTVTYDSSYGWYRWNVLLTGDQIKESILKSLKKRCKENPSLIKVKQNDGSYREGTISDIGNIENIRVNKRKEGGIVTSIIIKGDKRTIKVDSEYNIRLLLSPLYAKVNRKDNTVIDGMSLLPSAFFTIARKCEDGNISFYIEGGGYGHGVGMSQNGAGNMAACGLDYISILEHYFDGCDIRE